MCRSDDNDFAVAVYVKKVLDWQWIMSKRIFERLYIWALKKAEVETVMLL